MIIKNIGIIALGFLLTLSFSNCKNCKNSTKNITTATTNDSAVKLANKIQEIKYTTAQKYFVLNTFKGNLASPKIDNKEAFDKVFGIGAIMGKDGLATPIDFTKQYVVAVILPESDTATQIIVDSFNKVENGDLVLNYHIIKGEKQSFTSINNLLLIVDKSNVGTVITKETIQ